MSKLFEIRGRLVRGESVIARSAGDRSKPYLSAGATKRHICGRAKIEKAKIEKALIL